MSEKKAIRVAYGEALAELAATNDKIVVLDADLSQATMTNKFSANIPSGSMMCGIAEANMVDMAAGMSTMGLIPFCSTFAVFAGRSYDQIRNGVCYPHFNVKFGFSHAGVTLGEDRRQPSGRGGHRPDAGAAGHDRVCALRRQRMPQGGLCRREDRWTCVHPCRAPAYHRV